MPYWVVPSDGAEWSTHFVDLERDVTVADVRRALARGEHPDEVPERVLEYVSAHGLYRAESES